MRQAISWRYSSYLSFQGAPRAPLLDYKLIPSVARKPLELPPSLWPFVFVHFLRAAWLVSWTILFETFICNLVCIVTGSDLNPPVFR